MWHKSMRILRTMVSGMLIVFALKIQNVGSLCLCGFWPLLFPRISHRRASCKEGPGPASALLACGAVKREPSRDPCGVVLVGMTWYDFLS